jgi:pyruvate/2-oxoglutarate dehydrogenase complex dihydrolipoamide acyltransferase (E2) component
MGRRSLLAVIGWLVAAAAATVTGLTAVRVIGAGITGPGGGVMTPEQVAAAGTSPSATSTPGPATTAPRVEPSPSPSAAAERAAWSTPGGSVVAECDGTQVQVVSWTPAQGYRTKRADRRSDDHADVTFEGSAGKVEVRVWCAAGQPEASWKTED